MSPALCLNTCSLHVLRILVFLCSSAIYSSQGNDEVYYTEDDQHFPCDILETVNVTGDTRYENGSYLHEGVVIPSKLIGTYNYVYKNATTRIQVEPHLRGCICKLKPCINLCRPWHTFFESNITNDEDLPEPLMNITFNDGSEKNINLLEQFAVQYFRPCRQMYALYPKNYSYDEYQIFEDGSMILDNKTLNKDRYCLVADLHSETEYFIIRALNCYEEYEFPTVELVQAYAILISMPFMIVTILVYLLIPELRNCHGKSLICYLLGLTIGYSLKTFLTLLVYNDKSLSDLSCNIIGYTGYSALMSAFIWLSVISFDLWHSFRGIRDANQAKQKKNKRFFIYSCYSWGLTAIFSIFTWYAQTYLNIPDEYKPGIGGGSYCWLDTTTYSIMIYFYGPLIVIIVVNTVLFLLTALKIHRTQREMSRITVQTDSTKNLNTEKAQYILFLRLFIVMGVSWIFEIVSYMVDQKGVWAKIFYISDICNLSQGLITFMLFVMKRRVRKLIIKKLNIKSAGMDESTKINSTSIRSSSNANYDVEKLRRWNGIRKDSAKS